MMMQKEITEQSELRHCTVSKNDEFQRIWAIWTKNVQIWSKNVQTWTKNVQI